MKKWSTALLGAGLLAACSTTTAGYTVEEGPFVHGPKVLVHTLEDIRPDEEKSGAGAGLFNKSTKDALYEKEPRIAATESLIGELRARGINAVTSGYAPYELSGELCAYRAMIVPPRTAFIPYISYVTWLWSDDEITAGVTINLTLTAQNGTLLRETYALSKETKEWVGVAGLASTFRRLDSDVLVEVLRAGLKDVLTRAADDVSRVVK